MPIRSREPWLIVLVSAMALIDAAVAVALLIAQSVLVRASIVPVFLFARSRLGRCGVPDRLHTA
jgi:hypothetical protein